MDPFAIQGTKALPVRSSQTFWPPLLSAAFWGLGQAVHGERKKATVFFMGQIVCTLYLGDYFARYLVYQVMVSHFGAVFYSIFIFLFSVAGIALWLFNIYDAHRMALFLDMIAYRTVALGQIEVPAWDFSAPPPARNRSKTPWGMALSAVLLLLAIWHLGKPTPEKSSLEAKVEAAPSDFHLRRQLIEQYMADRNYKAALIQVEAYLSTQKDDLPPVQKQYFADVLAQAKPEAPSETQNNKGVQFEGLEIERVFEDSDKQDWASLKAQLSFEEFEEKALKAIETKEDDEAIKSLLSIYMEKQDWVKAKSLIAPALRKRPHESYLLEAMSAISARPVSAQAPQAASIKESQKPAQAEQRLAPDFSKAVSLYEEGKLDESLNILQQYFTEGGKDKEAFLLKNAILFQKKDYKASASLLQEALKEYPKDLVFLGALGKTEFRLEDYLNAITYFQQVLEIDPDQKEIHKNLGISYKKLGKYPESIASYRKALELDPTDESLLFLLGFSLLEANQNKEALEAYRKLTLINQNYPLLDFYRGEAEEKEGLPEDALLSYKNVKKDSPVYEKALKRIAKLEPISSEKAESAKVTAEKSNLPEVKPTNREEAVTEVSASMEAAEKAVLSQQFNLALNYYLKVLDIDSTNFRALSQVGRIYLEQEGDYAKAFEYLRKAQSIKGNDVLVNLNLGLIAKAKEEPKKAMEYFEKVLKLDSTNLQASFNLALLHEDKNQLDRAKQYYQKVIDTHPDYQLAYNYLGDLYYNEGNFHRAGELYKSLLSYSPQNSGIGFKLALCLEKEKNYRAAEQELLRLKAAVAGEELIEKEVVLALERVQAKL